MNPMLVEAIGSILRWGLTILAGYLVQRGIWTSSNAETYVAGAAMGLISLGWSFWQKYHMRLKFVTAAGEAGLSEHQVERMVKDPDVVNPSVTHPKDTVPTAVAMPPVEDLK